ncbi:MAG: amidohydrolase [Clostridiales bacterium]|jgi:amidohydrolase|nr:amidohydrolase [Clostridiales bacterium]
MYSKIATAVEKHGKLILDTERYIWKNPETGFREWKTSKYLAEIFEKLGYKPTMAGDIPGFYTDIDTGRPGPRVLILGELDALICSEHPEADPETHVVHCCGHNAQCAALVGIAAALREEGMLDEFCGSVRLCAVPAEEGIEIAFRQKLREQGVISYYGGKAEFLHRGYFDGVDIAFMIHTTTGDHAVIRKGSVGNIRKAVRYIGVAAHAGGSPSKGINALYAANLGLSAINALRETFREADLIRVHPIITNGGAVVNAIPSNVTLESYVRGKTLEAVERENKKINRALIGAAISMGARIEINDKPGYYPLSNDDNLIELTREAMEYVLGANRVKVDRGVSTGSTDMGDLSAVMPVIHPYMPGATGTPHGSDYYITDPHTACIDSAKVQLIMLHKLLSDHAARANYIIENKKVCFASKEEYFARIQKLDAEGERVKYLDNGEIMVLPL